MLYFVSVVWIQSGKNRSAAYLLRSVPDRRSCDGPQPCRIQCGTHILTRMESCELCRWIGVRSERICIRCELGVRVTHFAAPVLVFSRHITVSSPCTLSNTQLATCSSNLSTRSHPNIKTLTKSEQVGMWIKSKSPKPFLLRLYIHEACFLKNSPSSR